MIYSVWVRGVCSDIQCEGQRGLYSDMQCEGQRGL